MSINLGPEGCKAASELRGNDQFSSVIAAIKEQANKAANAALDASPDLVQQRAGYARALRDVFVALEAERAGVVQQKIKAPGVKE